MMDQTSKSGSHEVEAMTLVLVECISRYVFPVNQTNTGHMVVPKAVHCLSAVLQCSASFRFCFESCSTISAQEDCAQEGVSSGKTGWEWCFLQVKGSRDTKQCSFLERVQSLSDYILYFFVFSFCESDVPNLICLHRASSPQRGQHAWRAAALCRSTL